MRLTQRDIDIIEFLKRVVVADTQTILKIFFKEASLRTCQARLKLLVDNKHIKCFRENILEQNIYFISKKPSSYKHKIIFSRLIGEMYNQDIEIIKYKTPLKLHNIIADGFIIYRQNDQEKMAFIEVELTKYFDLKKYEDLYYSRAWKQNFIDFPGILVITDKKVKTNNKFDIKVSKLDLSDLEL